MCDGPDLFLCILAILFPPIAVWVKRGICSADSFINVALCILGYLPGLLHSWYIISSYPHPGYEQVPEQESHVHVYYVSGGPPPPSAGPTAGTHSTPQAGYGTIGPNRSQAKAKSNQPPTQPSSRPSQPSQRPGGSSRPQADAASQPAKPQEATLPKLADGEGAGPSDGAPPPSYADAVKGDNKIQSHA